MANCAACSPSAPRSRRGATPARSSSSRRAPTAPTRRPPPSSATGSRASRRPTRGRVDLEALKARLGPDVAAVMITNPNTCGLFEPEMTEISRAVHEAGGLVYCDGANFNAIVGRVRPGDLGIDAMHINLHKTFSTPHGGGGPGSGPVVFSEALTPFAPLALRREAGRSFRAGRGGDGRRASRLQLRPDGRLPRPDGHVHPGARLHHEPRRRRPEAGVGGRRAQRQLHPAAARRPARRAVRPERPLHARGPVQRQRLRRRPHHPRSRQGPDRRGLPPDDHVFPPGRPRRHADRADRDRDPRRRSTSSSAPMRSVAERAKAGDQSLKAAPIHAPRRRLDETLAARKPVLVWKEPDRAEAAE